MQQLVKVKIIPQDVCWIMNTLKLENYRLIAFGLRRLKQLHVNPKAIQKNIVCWTIKECRWRKC